MTLLDYAITRATRGAVTKAAAPVRIRADVNAERWDVPESSRLDNQIELYRKLAWVRNAVDIVARTAAATPYKVMRNGKPVDKHPFVTSAPGVYGSLRQPNPRQSRSEFLQATFSWLLAAGNCYWWLNRAGPEYAPAELWIIPASQIEPVPDGNMDIRGYLYDPNGARLPLEVHEVVHFKNWNPFSKYVGLSPIEALMYDGHADIAAQKYNANFYGKDNAKSAGFLAFADYIPQDAWDKLKLDFSAQNGGTKQNRVMYLRGVGERGVQWIPAQLSQAETQYLEARTFTKEEVYELIAPGLASLLAVNSTEANSVSGMDTLLSMCVYPLQVAVSEKIDSDVLPVYGDDLDGEFDDVRRTDTEIELKEQQEYAKTHTVDEVRQKYYGDKPLGDERGAALVAPAQSSGGASLTSDMSERANAVGMLIRSGFTPAAALAVMGLPPIEHTGLLPVTVQKPQDGTTIDASGDVTGRGTAPDPAMALQQAGAAVDAQKWYTKSMKALAAGRSPDVPFSPDYMGDDRAMTIRAALKHAQTAEDVAGAFE